ncbi:MAG: rhomboid family intramembrane serine protease [Saprospiraceae bacterium]|nr:MAG: rhomboid family intramembrane serine protease [Saprospiraceae bacterium]
MFPIQDTIPSRSFPLMNWALIGLNVFVFFIQASLPPDEIEYFIRQWGLVPADFSGVYGRPESIFDYYPFLTNMFLHGGIGHLIGNMWTLYIFGDNVEDRMGKFRYLVFYVLCGVIASYTHYVLNIESVIPAVGASGAISGVMGAYMLMFPHSRIIFVFPFFFLPYFFEISAFVYLALWFLGQLLSGTTMLFAGQDGPGIAFWAHIGGFVAGMGLFKFFDKGIRGYRTANPYDWKHRYRDYYSDF